MISQEVAIVNRLGLHARAAAKLVECAGRFASRIEIRKGESSADAKSIMSVMMLAAGKGMTLELTADGQDEVEAVEAIVALFADRFGEPD